MELVNISIYLSVGLGGLGVTWSPRDPRFAGSNPAEIEKDGDDSLSIEHKYSNQVIN